MSLRVHEESDNEKGSIDKLVEGNGATNSDGDMLHTTQLSAEQSGLQNDVGDAIVAADLIVTLSQDTKRQKRAAAAKRQQACRANAKANTGVEAISKKRAAEPARQPVVRSKKRAAEPARQSVARSKTQAAEPARQPGARSSRPSHLEAANAVLFLFFWSSFRLDLDCS